MRSLAEPYARSDRWSFSSSSRCSLKSTISSGERKWLAAWSSSIEDAVDDAGDPLRVDHVERHPIEHPAAQLDALRGREDPLVRLDTDQHAVAFEQLGREAVVVGDLRFLAVGEVEPRQRVADALLEVLGGLVREREAQDVARKDPA